MSIDESTFVRALLGGDRVTLDEALADEAVFNSPVRSYAARADVLHLLSLIGTLMSDAEVVRRYGTECAAATLIRSRQDEGVLEGVIEERRDALGRVCEATLMLRPVAVMMPTIKRMGALLEAHPLPSAAH